VGTVSRDEAGVFLLDDLEITKLAILFGLTPAVPASEQAIFKSLDYVDKQTREDLHNAQKARAKRYGIQILEAGNLTMPADAKAAGATTDADYADPTNYKFPTFAGHDRLNDNQMGKLRNAPARFAQFGDVYNATSRRKVEARIQAALKKFKIGAYREEKKSMDEFDLDTLLKSEEFKTMFEAAVAEKTDVLEKQLDEKTEALVKVERQAEAQHLTAVAKELGVEPEKYVKAIQKARYETDEQGSAVADLVEYFGDVIKALKNRAEENDLLTKEIGAAGAGDDANLVVVLKAKQDTLVATGMDPNLAVLEARKQVWLEQPELFDEELT